MTFLFLIVAIGLTIWAQFKVKNAYKKYAKIANNTGLTGAEVARRILDHNGLFDIDIQEVAGELSDHYDPSKKVLRLSSNIYHGHSIAGTAVAAHEVGHAIQDQHDYVPMKVRAALVPAAQFGSSVSWILILAGFIFGWLQLAFLGVIFFSAAVLFQLVTLPVEFNASSRALVQLNTLGLVQGGEERHAKKMLNAAAFTYVAAALVAVAQLLRFIMIFTRQD